MPILTFENKFRRYSCEQSDNLAKYGWLKHDGRTFGSQEIVDDDFILTTDFVKQDGGFHGGDWTARIKGRPRFGGVSTKRKEQTLYNVMFVYLWSFLLLHSISMMVYITG